MHAYAFLGGKDYGETWYRPDQEVHAKAYAGMHAEKFFVDADAVYVGIGASFYRYERRDTAARRLILMDGVPPGGFTVGNRFVGLRGAVPFTINVSGKTLALQPLSPGGGPVARPTLRAPYLLYRSGRLWYGVDVDRAAHISAYGPQCDRPEIAAGSRAVIFACQEGGSMVLAAFATDRRISFDAILRAQAHVAQAGATPVPTSAPDFRIPLSFQVTPNRSRSDLRPRFLSPAVRSLAFQVDDDPPDVVDLFATKNCQPDDDGLACVIPTRVPMGSHRLRMLVWDGDGATGKILARASESYVNDGGPHLLTINVRGIVAAISLRLSDPALVLHSGQPADIPIVVLAIDPDGYPILNVADFASPISIVLDAPAGTRTSQSEIRAAGSSLVVHYDGSPSRGFSVTARTPDGVTATLPIAIQPPL
jgi:hypothetical protein